MKLPIWDRRMFELMQFCISTDKVKTQREFLQLIGMHETGLHQVKAGRGSFTLEHFAAAGKRFGVNMNWFFGMETEMFSNRKQRSPLARLKEAVLAVELEIKGR